MKKKVNWGDREYISQIVADSISYAAALKKLKLKTVSANTQTLKKYIKKYDIDTSHFGNGTVSDVLVDRIDGNDGKTPQVVIKGIVQDPVKGIKIELDWNTAFVDYLRQNEYHGTNDEAIVQHWVTHLAQNLMEEFTQPDSAGSEFEG